MDTQSRLPPALAALHNFIRKHDPDDIAEFGDDVDDPQPGTCAAGRDEGQLLQEVPRAAERQRAKERRDRIAQEMWAQ
jgi:hypothetical protein